jgi:filamentous hemagglutinin family protein
MERFPTTYWLLSGGILLYLLTPKPTAAQIVPDATLPNNSIVLPNCTDCEITGGTTEGNNLFHSFEQFSIPTGGVAYFNNAQTVENIISRVTGKSVSNIDGLIRANGIANLFLLNPNGIIFGPNASLNIGGSFLASTASSLKFADGKEFSALTPQTTPLLTVSVPIGLQYGENAGSIVNQSQAKDNSGNVVGLQVQPGKSLALVGGNVRLDGGSLQAANGRIELGGVGEAKTVGVEVNGNNLFLNFPLDVDKADVLLTNAAKVDVADIGSGSVIITARNLNIEKRSSISAGIKPNLTASGSVPGDITLNATEAMKINENSLVENVAATAATGNTGDINVNANLFELTGGGRLRTRTLGSNSDAGDISIKAGDIYINNPEYKLGDENGLPQEDKPALDASNFKYDGVEGKYRGVRGRGRSGNISLEANGSITLIGQGVNRENKVISTYNGRSGLGGGDISLVAKGSILLDNAYLVTTVINDSEGGAGKILLQGDASVSLTNNSQLTATTYGTGDPGNITLRSNGSVSVQASLINADIRNKVPKSNDAGNIYIFGRSVFITDGSEVAAKTSENGSFGGSIQVNATDIVEISGIHPLFSDPKFFQKSRPQSVYSTLTTTTEEKGKGPGGNIIINTDTLRVTDGASLKAETQGAFPGGNITVNARVVELTGGGKLITSASDKGNAGDINLNVSNRVIISDQNPNFQQIFDQIVARKIQEGDTTEEAKQSAQTRLGTVGAASGIYASTFSTNGGNITLNIKDLLLLRHGGQISTSAGIAQADGDGGNININTPFIVAFPSENSDITANAYEGKGGNVKIKAQGIFGIQPREQQTPESDITASSQFGLSGTVEINTPDVDPSQELVELPTVPVNVQIAQGCQTGGQASVAFFNTGKGGLAPSPYEPLSSSNIWEDVPTSTQMGIRSAPEKIIEAQGWVKNEKGEVILVAQESGCPFNF